MPTLPDSVKKKIKEEAEAHKKQPHYNNGKSLSVAPQIYLKRGYIAGASHYYSLATERIAELEKQNEKLREALEKIEKLNSGQDEKGIYLTQTGLIANNALK